jgi:hypothetical protein
MKSFIITLLFISLAISSYSQDKQTKQDRHEGLMKVEDLPAVVIKRIGADFSVYIPDNHPDKDVRRLEEKFIAYDIGTDYKGAESYLLIMQTKNSSLSATYNGKGKLIRVVEKYKNVRLPNAVLYSIYNTYPDYTIVNDKYLYTQEEGDILKKQYNLKIKNGRRMLKLTVHSNGEIVKVR